MVESGLTVAVEIDDGKQRRLELSEGLTDADLPKDNGKPLFLAKVFFPLGGECGDNAEFERAHPGALGVLSYRERFFYPDGTALDLWTWHRVVYPGDAELEQLRSGAFNG